MFDVRSKADRGERQYRELLVVGAQSVPILYRRNRSARRYILRISADGAACVTIPRGGHEAGARHFAQQHTDWIQQQIQKRAAQTGGPAVWHEGAEIFFRGERVHLNLDTHHQPQQVRFADQSLPLKSSAADLRPPVQQHLWRLARLELPSRTLELAAQHGLKVKRVSVRNQHTRWGSCSLRATISLNWRLIQTPPFVRDYIILHELMHLREMNHSARYWQWVEKVCPDYLAAEAWLKAHSKLLH